ncbi:MAG: hypothetical protein KDB23_18595, partial [Planctomycetales bacterium]|nr:hypothetical protein [Planctomycetales bacterium]
YPVQSSTPLADIPIYSPVNRLPSFVELAPVGDGDLAVTVIHAALNLSRNTLKMSKELEEFGASQLMQRVTTVSAETANMSWSKAEEPPQPNTLPLEPGDGVSVARGVIRVPETGTYTFQVKNTGNFVLQLGDAEFEHAYGNAAIDRVDPSIMYYSGNSFEPKSRASVHLTAGLHELSFLNSGLAPPGVEVRWEITTTSGDVANEGDATWLALGDGRSVGAHVVTPIAHMVSAAQVINVDYNSRSFVTDVEFARAVLEDEESQLPHYERNDVTTLVVSDGDSICCARPSQTLPEENRYLLPINDESLGGSKSILDNFYTRVSGQLVLDDGDEDATESLEVTFAVFGQNQMQFHIEGVDFNWGHVPTELDYVVGDDVALTDNSQPELGPPGSIGMFGSAVLNEGQVYDFDGIVVNARDQAAYEVWVAPGANINRFDPHVFSPLSSTLLSRTVPGNVGLTFAGSKLGDFNGDGLLDVADLELQRQKIGSTDSRFDLNGDDVVDQADRIVWLHELKQTWVGDSNLDGVFDSQDLVSVFAVGKYELPQSATWAEGDWNGDGVFGTTDLVAAWQDGGYEAGTFAAVPEPSAGLLSCTAFALLAWRGRSYRQGTKATKTC